MPRWLFITCNVLFIGVVSLPLMTGVSWVGSKTLPVEVLVLDTEDPSAIAGATIVAFRGPQYIEGDIKRRSPSYFEPSEHSGEIVEAVTDEQGTCRIEYRFFAAGMNRLFYRSGYVRTGDVWLRVSAPDRPTTLVHLDCQSVHPRDIHDTTPLVVTAVLNKQRSNRRTENGSPVE